MAAVRPLVFARRDPATALSTFAYLALNNVAASLTFFALLRFDIASFADPAVLADLGPTAAEPVRWASLVDMVGYLAFAPVVVGLDGRFRAGGRAGDQVLSLLRLCGLGFVMLGSIGAVLLAAVGPSLIVAAADPATAVPGRLAFSALANAVFVGLWGTLELALYGTWLAGVGWLVRSEGRAFSALGVVSGLGALAYSVRTGLTGRTPAELSGPLDVLIFAGVSLGIAWLAWLVVRLWRGR